jgi:protein-L-isoaspartate(D-aspartate) O-methyltransferase
MEREYQQKRQIMVANLEAAGIADARVLDAIDRVPRHLFVPERERPYAYEDRALPIGEGQTISQPYIVAKMLEALQLDGTERVLDVGTGSGYQAALLGLLARDVYSVEIVASLERSARQLLERLGLRNVRVVHGNGSLGYPKGAPYDAIACAAGAPEVPMELIDQLADGGRLVIPVGTRCTQRLVCIHRNQGKMEVEDLCACIFVPLVGDAGWPTIAA